MKSTELAERDLKHIWHPCSQMKDYELLPPVPVKKARGPFIYTEDGKEIIDAISSWWCKSLGHGHPRIKAAVKKQLDSFEHIIGANTCCETLVELSENLSALCPGLEKVFYADNGSTAIEIAMKMSLQYHAQTGNQKKKNFLALKNGYHGESILCLAAGDCELYSSPFKHLIPEIKKIGPFPYLSGQDATNWNTFPEDIWNNIKEELDEVSSTISAIVFEPILQGAGGMLIYSPELLRKLREWTSANGIHLIADEIMTGFGRTGKMLACEHAGIKPDFIALSKGLTAGFAPMSAVLTSNKIYSAFYDDYFSGKAFLHSNTYSGYAPGAAAALETIAVYKEENIIAEVTEKSSLLKTLMQHIADETGALQNVRGIGFSAAADIVNPATGKAFPREQRKGFEVFRRALEHGAWLRPLGDTVYFLPPLNIEEKTLEKLTEITLKSIKEAIQ